MAHRTVSTLVLASLLCVALPVRAEDVPISPDARAHFAAGVNLLQDPDGAKYEEAYGEFKAAYQISPSWKILGNLGIAAFKLERDGEALAAFEKYLADGGQEIDAEERAQFERDAQTLRASMVRLKLSSDPPGAVISDERQPQSGGGIRNRYSALRAPTELGVRAGHHRFTASLAGRPDVVWEVDLQPGQTVEHVFTFQAAQAAPGPSSSSSGAAPVDAGPPDQGENTLRTLSYVALGVGVVGLGAGTLFAVQAKGKYDDANEFCPSFPCDLTRSQANERQDAIDEGDGKKTLSIVGFAVGGVGLATGATLFLLSGRKPEQAAQGFHVTPLVGINTFGVTGGF
jgi:hypothetical protein